MNSTLNSTFRNARQVRNLATRQLSALVVAAAVLHATSASAALLAFTGNSSDGHPVAGSAEFTLNDAANTVTVKLTNTTATTLDAGELFTGLDFSIGGLSASMTSDTGIERTVASNGTFSDTGSAQDLSWSLVSLGSGNYQLNFNPDAKDAILGPPSGGDYSGANGSIKGNAGHNPFAALMAVFELSVPQLAANTPVEVTTFRYGTELDPATGTINPEPAAWLLLLVGAALFKTRRRS